MTKRKKYIKFFLVVLASVLSIVLITGCSNTTSTKDQLENQLKPNQQEETEPTRVRSDFLSGINTAIENNESMLVDENLQYNDALIKIENALWEDNELAITYTTNESGYILGLAELVNANGERINNGSSSEFSEDSGTMIFRGINDEAMQSGTVWLRIYSLNNVKAFQNDGGNYSFPSVMLKTTKEMKKGETININKNWKLSRVLTFSNLWVLAKI